MLVAAALALTGCVQSSYPKARADAVDAAREEAVAVQDTLSRALAEEADASALIDRWDDSPAVFASSVREEHVTLDYVVVGRGFHGDGVGRESTSVRGCVRYTGTTGSARVDVEDVECPAGPHTTGAPTDTATLFS